MFDKISFRIPESGKHYILTQGPIDKDDQRHRTLSNSMMLMLGNTVGERLKFNQNLNGSVLASFQSFTLL